MDYFNVFPKPKKYVDWFDVTTSLKTLLGRAHFWTSMEITSLVGKVLPRSEIIVVRLPEVILVTDGSRIGGLFPQFSIAMIKYMNTLLGGGGGGGRRRIGFADE